IENEIKRKKLQLRNMKKLLTHADFYGREKGKKSNKHPLMKPTGSNPQKVEALEKNIAELEMQLMGRQPGGSAGGMEDFKEGYKIGRGNEEDREPQGPPSNEREARLQKRLLERLARQKKHMYGGGGGGGERQTRKERQVMSAGKSRIHMKGGSDKVKQIYVDKAAARGAWGEHGLGLPGLAKDNDKNSAHNKLRQEQEQEREKERRAKEALARRAREMKILEQKAREKEEEDRAREVAVKLNYTFKPPEAFGGGMSDDEEEEEEKGGEGEEKVGEEKVGEEKVGEEKVGEEEEEGSLSDDSIGDGRRKGRGTATAGAVQASRRRVFAQRPQNLHAKTKPRQNGAHNLFKVYSPPRSQAALPGHGKGGTGGKGRPSTAGVASRPQTSARKYNFINMHWGT
ncbi:hypothetical protein TrRE_jg4308, partial [Triparma retinervis]